MVIVKLDGWAWKWAGTKNIDLFVVESVCWRRRWELMAPFSVQLCRCNSPTNPKNKGLILVLCFVLIWSIREITLNFLCLTKLQYWHRTSTMYIRTVETMKRCATAMLIIILQLKVVLVLCLQGSLRLGQPRACWLTVPFIFYDADAAAAACCIWCSTNFISCWQSFTHISMS